MNRLITIILALLISSATATPDITATVPGDLLGWETGELNVVIQLLDESEIRLDVFSPAFDPDDYRAALEGRTEIGDERYDGGQGSLEALFTLIRNGETLLERSFGVAPHATETLFSGTLPAGEYHLKSTFTGNAKNTFAYTLTADPAASIYFGEQETMLFNIRGHELQDTLTVHVAPEDVPLTFQLYDGDGVSELRGRLTTPSGPLEIPVSGNLEWSTIRIGQPGTHTFSFYQPEGAYQHSNTIGLRVDARLQVTGEGLRVVRAAPVTVRIVDTDGKQLPGEYSISEEGHLRAAILEQLPDNYRLVDTRSEGGVIEAADRVTFGPLGGVAIFVAERIPPPPSLLTITATLEYPGVEQPWPLTLTLDDATTRLGDSGSLTLEVTPGLHRFTVPEIPGATISGPARVLIQQGDHAQADFIIRPQVHLDLTVDVNERWVAEQFIFTATASTDFPDALPAQLTLTLPAGLQPHAPLSGSSTIRAGTPYQLSTSATGLTPGVYDVHAELQPWQLRTAVTVRVNALPVVPEPVMPEPEPEPEPEPQPEPEPVVIPEPEPEPEPAVLPEFTLERASTVHLDFQAGEIVRCELPGIAPGASSSVLLDIRSDAAISAARIEPQVQPAQLSVSSAQTSATGDAQGNTATISVTVSNDGAEASSGTLLVPLPVGSQLVAASGMHCSVSSGAGQELQVTPAVPEGGTYLAGSTLLGGEAFAEPTVLDNGNLAWRFPYRLEGTISYGISHEIPLGELAEPTLTVQLGNREDQLVGAAPLVKPAAAARFSSEQLENAGPAAALAFEGIQLLADGRTPLEVQVLLTDEHGVPTGSGFVTIGVNAEPLAPGASSRISGYQIQLADGVAVLELAPALHAFDLNLEALVIIDGQEFHETATLSVTGTRTGLYQGQASITARVTGGFQLSGTARGYVEAPLGRGTLQAALDIAADADGLDVDRTLNRQPDPADRNPLTGAGNEAAPTLRSSDGIAVLYSTPGASIGYYHAPSTVPALSGLPVTTALHGNATVASNLRVQGFAALLPDGRQRHTITPDGTRRYSIGQAILRGSESVRIITGDSERELQRYTDYSLEEWLGVITLVEPLWSTSADLEEVTLVIDYAPEGATRNQLAAGAGVRYETTSLTIEAGAAYVEHFKASFNVAYRSDQLSAGINYTLSFEPDGTELTGRAHASYELTDSSTLLFDHESGKAGKNTSSIRYRHSLHLDAMPGQAADAQTLSASVGIKYAWHDAALSALLGAGYEAGAFGARLEHAQPLADSISATTRAGVSYHLNENLTARADFELAWGDELRGTLGLDQRLGDTQLALTYELPTVSGEGNRARFGVRSPLPLADNVFLDLQAGLLRSFAAGDTEVSAGAAVRYQAEALRATLGAEIAHSAAGFKLLARGGVAGQISADQTIAVDANYQLLPVVEGRFSAAYSLKRGPLNFLTYHRMLNSPSRALIEGEAAPTVNFAQRVQLRPSVAYRVFLDDPEGSAYQASLFAIGYFDAGSLRLGAGGGAHALWQPGTASVSYGASAELQARLIDEVWLGLGYTFAGFHGITPETSGGLYLRLDLVTGGQF
jgi:hypothetical protein